MNVYNKESSQNVVNDYKPNINLKIEEASKKYGDIFEQAIIKFVDNSYKSNIKGLEEIFKNSNINFFRRFCSNLKQSLQFMGIDELDYRIEAFINSGINNDKVDWSKLEEEKPFILKFLKEMYNKCDELYPSFIGKYVDKIKNNNDDEITIDESKLFFIVRK